MICYTKKVVIFFVAISVMLLRHVEAQVESGNSFENRKQAAIEELKKFPNADTNRVDALLRIITTAIFLKEKKEVASFLPEALKISRDLNYRTGMGNCYLQRAGYYKSSSDYATAIKYYDSALTKVGNTPGDKFSLVRKRALEQKGSIYYSQENYYKALDYYFEALKIALANDREREIRLYAFITEIYTLLNNLEKAEEFAKKNVALAEQEPGIKKNIFVYFSVIDVCLEKNDLKAAEFYLDKISAFIPDPKEVQENFGYYLKRGRLNYQQQKYTDAYQYFKETYKYAHTGGHSNSINFALNYLSATALKLGLNEEAKNYALQNLALAHEMRTKSLKIDALTNLSNYYAEISDNKKAYQFLQHAMELKDSATRENNIKQLNVLGVMYEYGKQQEAIGRLETEKEKQLDSVKQKSLLNNIFIASIIVLLFIGYLGYANFRKSQQLSKQQQTLQHQKIIELEKDKQLATVEAMLKGQEEERSRIAKDLHDGLGSLLSGTKLSFMNVKENLALSGENKVLFERSLSMLDNTIGDLRKVAQNLMPEALVKFGLHEALRDFCDAIQSSSGIKVLYQQFGERRKLENTAEVFIYRIIQELVNNAVKHADAKTIMVQLAIDSSKTGITVEDDGKGFDADTLLSKKGSGQSNINYRVAYFNGTCDIVTSPENGTSVNIELMA